MIVIIISRGLKRLGSVSSYVALTSNTHLKCSFCFLSQATIWNNGEINKCFCLIIPKKSISPSFHEETSIFPLFLPNHPRCKPIFHTVFPGPFPFNDQSWLKNRQRLTKSERIHCSLGTMNTFELKHQPEGLLELGCGHTRPGAYS